MPSQQRADQIFYEARQMPDAERAAYLDGACGVDLSLRSKVEALLAADAAAGSFLATAGLGDPTVALTPSGEQPGQTIGRYKLLERIGEGGFGSVWAAEQREPVRRRVALKIIKLGMDTKQVIARFEAERQALAMMDHPNIAKVLDAGSTEAGRPYFVMELVKGVPITEYCDKEMLDTRGRLDLFMKVCHAIQHAHQKGIIHRDIKPSNVLVTLHDGVPVPKVIDFGIAKATNQELTEKTIFTQHRQMIGTPAYMSPEQAEMSGLDIDTRSDIYSLGVLLYELLTGTTPFDGKSLMEAGFAEMMRIIREETPHKPSTRLSSLGDTGTRTAEQRRVDLQRLGTLLKGDLDWIVMKCLEKDRTRRYETANGLAADIQRHLSDEPVTAGPPSTSYRLRKFVKRNRGRVIAAGVIAAALVLGVVGTSTGMAWALREKGRADTEANRATAAATEAHDNELKARDEAERAERELTRANEIKGLIKDMLTSVTPEEAKGQDTTLLKKILDDASQRLDKDEIKDELVAAELHHVVGNVYLSLGLYPQAETHLTKAVEIRTRRLGEEHSSTLDSTSRLAWLYTQEYRYAEAELLFKKVLEDRMSVLGPEHPDTLASMCNLATVYLMQDRYAEAEPLYEKVLEIDKRVLGDEDPTTLATMGGLAALYQNQGQYAEAEALHKNVLEIDNRVLGPEHPDTLRANYDLAELYAYQGRYAEAESLLEKVLEIETRVLGAEHPHTLRAMANLANVYALHGRHAEAALLYKKVLEIDKRVLGAEHPETLATMTNLGLVHNEMGRYEDAAKEFEVCLPVMRRVLGTEHQWTQNAMKGLADACMHLDRRAEAVALYSELREPRFAAADKPDASASTLNRVAWDLLTNDLEELRDPAKALGYARRACAAEAAAKGANLWAYLDTLALAQHLTGDNAGAVETQKRAIALMPADSADPDMPKHLAEYEAALAESGG
ncbi:MAG: serine/threonine protein kinase [Phycisphaerales bacterium]|nr:serine/threonine protein kinase [Phycisphaerales bacterium]